MSLFFDDDVIAAVVVHFETCTRPTPWAPEPPSACEDCGSENPEIHYAGCVLAKTAGR